MSVHRSVGWSTIFLAYSEDPMAYWSRRGPGLPPWLPPVSDSNMCPTENRHFLVACYAFLHDAMSVGLSVCLWSVCFFDFFAILLLLPTSTQLGEPCIWPCSPIKSIFLSLSVSKSISVSLPVYFCPFIALSFFYLVSDARAFPGRPRRPASYALARNDVYHE